MSALLESGSTVRFLVPSASPAAQVAHDAGIPADQYLLDEWNVVRARSRMRKYLLRYAPVAVHSTGIEADLIVRWAARKVAGTRVVHTLTDDPQGTRRGRPMDALMRRFDEFGMRTSDAVFVTSDALGEEVTRAGVAPARVIVVPETMGETGFVRCHIELYREFLCAPLGRS
jgi:hypothetical protein